MVKPIWYKSEHVCVKRTQTDVDELEIVMAEEVLVKKEGIVCNKIENRKEEEKEQFYTEYEPTEEQMKDWNGDGRFGNHVTLPQTLPMTTATTVDDNTDENTQTFIDED